MNRAVDAVIEATPSLDQSSPEFDTQGVANPRWILAHLLEETARHAGHADILRELIDVSTGSLNPLNALDARAAPGFNVFTMSSPTDNFSTRLLLT